MLCLRWYSRRLRRTGTTLRRRGGICAKFRCLIQLLSLEYPEYYDKKERNIENGNECGRKHSTYDACADGIHGYGNTNGGGHCNVRIIYCRYFKQLSVEVKSMSVLMYLIPLALILGLVGLGAFVWSLKSGQYDDLDGAANRILIDDENEK